MGNVAGVGTQGVQNGVGLRGLQGPGQNSGQQVTKQDIEKLFQALLDKINQGAQNGKCAGGQPAQQAQGGQGAAGADEGGLQDLIQKLKEMAEKNPEAFAAAMKNNPAFAQVAQVALGGGGGGGSIGKVH